MSLVTLSSEDCEMIEKSIDMIALQCKMITNMLRRSRDASGVPLDARRRSGSPESSSGVVEMLNNAMSTLTSTVRQVSNEAHMFGDGANASRKRARPRSYASNGISGAATDDSANDQSLTSPPAVKRRGRPPRDYGDELGPAFAMYAHEMYARVAQGLAASGMKATRNDVLRAVWDSWWLSAQAVKDKYLTLSRHEMAVNETNLLELLLDYPLPPDAAAAAAASVSQAPRSASSAGYTPEPVTPVDAGFELFVREQVPLLRPKVPEWSDAEMNRRLAVNWGAMPQHERDRYSAAAMSPANGRANGSTNGSLSVANGTAPRSGTPTPGQHASSQSAPRRAYVLFCRRERPTLVRDNPEWDLPTVNKELGRRWKELDATAREFYQELERKEAEVRTAQGGDQQQHSPAPPFQRPGGYFGVLQATSPAAGRSGARGGSNPNKGPSKAYVFYSRLNRKSVTAENPEWDLATINRELGRMWKALPPGERADWEARAAASLNRNATPTKSSPVAQDAGSAAQPPCSPLATEALAASTEPTTAPQSDADMAGDSEAEDVEMMDDDTEDEQHRLPRSPPGDHAVSPATTVSQTPSAAPPDHLSAPNAAAAASLIKLQTPVAGPPPTAKPAAASTPASEAAPSPAALPALSAQDRAT
ncbi:hypothetical protein GGI07_000343 [Coemansia sp. Benny D115]|nr:hypothetical protein GGI07_000343 [Coemansia sp. Benny D115]